MSCDQLDFFGDFNSIPEEASCRKCRICGKNKPLSQFHLCHSERVVNGKLYAKRYRSECKVCRGIGGKAHSSQGKKLMQELNMQRPTLGTPCGCCGKKTEMLVFDHDHQTNKFRGWLCYQCNSGIGLLGDDIAGLEKALQYLNKEI
jgi:hypothetical protein